MALYQLIWRLFAGAVAAVGIVLEVLTHPISTVVALSALSLGVAICVGLGMRVGESDVVVPVGTTVNHIVKGTLLSIAALTALVGLATLGVMTMLFIAAAVVVTSPPFVAKVFKVDVSVEPPASIVDEIREEGQWRFAPPVETAQPASMNVSELATADVRSMGTRELVRDWRRSYVALEQASDSATKMALVQARQAFLDELERRNPDGLHEWLESGARAAGDPTKFMSAGGENEANGPQAA
jgi:hypothetical protein